MSAYRYCFFDLDGTLTDSAPGITESVRYAMQRLGVDLPPTHDLTCFIGPPLLYAFSTFFGLSEQEATRAVSFYREHYRAGAMLNCHVYDGMREALTELNARGVTCVLATCKPHEFAVRILEHFDLKKHFAFVSGPELDGTRNEKHEVIAYAIEQLAIPSPEQILMIGDRRDDVLGARRNDVDCLGVRWGFGSEAELCEAGAIALISHPNEIIPALIHKNHTKK